MVTLHIVEAWLQLLHGCSSYVMRCNVPLVSEHHNPFPTSFLHGPVPSSILPEKGCPLRTKRSKWWTAQNETGKTVSSLNFINPLSCPWELAVKKQRRKLVSQLISISCLRDLILPGCTTQHGTKKAQRSILGVSYFISRQKIIGHFLSWQI